jgi:hypothetical protein
MRYSLIPLFLFATSALADEVHLKDGKVLSGRVVDEGTRLYVVDRDRKHLVKRADVVRVEEKRSFMDDYEERLAALPADDAEAIFEFGQWLEENDWATRARRAYEEVLEQDPDHRGARRALGYKLYEGEWVSPDELNRRKGLVYFEDDGRWYTPHDLEELKREIERNETLRQTLDERRKVTERVNRISRGFASFDKKSRQKAYDDLTLYAEEVNSPEIRKFADDTKAYYDEMVRVLCAQMMARTEIHAVHTKLKRPIDTFETSLGAAIAVFAAQNPVKIQLPEIAIAEVHSTVDIPAGCR